LVEIVVFERGWANLSANFRRYGASTKIIGVRKLESLGHHVAWFA